MVDTNGNPLVYYAQPGMMTSTNGQSALLKGLPAEIPALCKVVQNVLVHIFWMDRYGVQAPDERKQREVNLRRASSCLAYVQAMDNRMITIPRPVEKRVIGNCRDFSVLLCTLLRHQGIPARARCGFGTYFTPDHYEDHWVCEYWNEDQSRWVLVDAQLDELQSGVLQIDFDPTDVPHDRFLTAGRVWQKCRTGEIDPDKCGIFDMHGLWFVSGNLLRDFASLNKVELLPWDIWGMMGVMEQPAENLELLDRVAALTLAGNENFAEVRALYEGDDRLRVPPTILSWVAGATEPTTIDLAALEPLPEPVQPAE